MRAIYTLTLGSLIVGSLAAIACSSEGSTGSDESNATSKDAGVDPRVEKMKAAMAKLNGAWKGADGAEPVALVFTASDFGDGPQLSVSRDSKHVPTDPKDKGEIDRNFPDFKLLTVDTETTGTLELRDDKFGEKTITRTTETYRYELKSADGKDTLTLTETDETVTESGFGAPKKDAGAPKSKKNAVRAPFTVTKVDSWCAPQEGGEAVFDCQSQFGTVWNPTNTPAACKDKETNCMRCEAHACKMVEVSSCEIEGNFCFESVAACQFQDGQPAGQVSRINTEGVPIDCEKSPSGKKICCNNIFSGRGEGGD